MRLILENWRYTNTDILHRIRHIRNGHTASHIPCYVYWFIILNKFQTLALFVIGKSDNMLDGCGIVEKRRNTSPLLPFAWSHKLCLLWKNKRVLPYCVVIHLRPVLLIWFDFNPSMDIWVHAQQSVGWNNLSTTKLQRLHQWISKWISNFTPQFVITVITYPCWD